MRPRQQKGGSAHYLIAINKQAGDYSDKTVRRLTGAIRREGSYYTVIEPESYDDLRATVRDYCRLSKSTRSFPPPVMKRGKVTSLVAGGGDGTVNAVASVALEADLPMGILPMGRANSIALSLCTHGDLKAATQAIVARKYRTIDVAKLGSRVIVGSLAIGLVPKVYSELKGRGMPRFSFWLGSLVSKAAAATERIRFIAKVDAFRFDIDAKMFSLNLLPYSMGMRLSPASVPDDGQGEIIFDVNTSDKDLGQYIRDVYKGRYVYGSQVRLYRGSYISFNPGKGRIALLDGDLVELPDDDFSFQLGSVKLKLFC